MRRAGHQIFVVGRLLVTAYLASWSGCAPAVAVLPAEAPAGPPRAPSAVRVYLDEQSVPAGYQELGLIIANTHLFVPMNFSIDTTIAMSMQSVPRGNQRNTDVFRALVRRAARLGADGVIVRNFNRAGETLTISGVAIRTRCAQLSLCRPGRPPKIAMPPSTVPAPIPAPAPPPPVDCPP